MLSSQQRSNIQNIIIKAIRNKLATYSPESAHMPFHTRLLGHDRMALYRFIHSLNTAFGSSIFEPVAKTIAENYYPEVSLQKRIGNIITVKAETEITTIINALTTASLLPNYKSEFKRIHKVCREGQEQKVKLPKADLFLRDNSKVYLIDIKTTKPNISDFQKHKSTMLRWIAATLYQDTKQIVETIIAMPYNPYYPQPYNRWTLRGMLDLRHQLMVGEDFWNFLAGGKLVFPDLLACFEAAGQQLHTEISEYFSFFSKV